MRLRNQVLTVVALTSFFLLVSVLAMYRTIPASIGPNWVTLWFLGFMLSLSGLFGLILFGLKRFLLPELAPRPLWYASLRQGFLAASWVTIVLALSSLRQLTLRDGFLTAILLLLVELYIRLK
jgi:hypothetical protein